MKRVAGWLGALLLAGAAQAEGEAWRWEAEAGAGHERLGAGRPDWRQADLALRGRWAPRSEAEAGLRRVQRYGRTDHELGLGLALPLDAQWSAALRGTLVDGPQFLPRQGGQVELSRQWPAGWVTAAALGRNLYASAGSPGAGTSLLRLGVEHYAGAWRHAGAWTRTRLDGGATASGWRLQLDRYIGERGRLGVLVASGDELEPAPGGVLSTRVDTLVLTARWPLDAAWALSGELGRTRIGGIARLSGDAGQPTGPGYRRTGARVAVQRLF